MFIKPKVSTSGVFILTNPEFTGLIQDLGQHRDILIYRKAMSTSMNQTTTKRHVSSPCNILHASDTKLIDTAGKEVILKGAVIGGMLNMVNFITGYAGRESEHSTVMTDIMGKKKVDYFFSRLISYFIPCQMPSFLDSLGLNRIRLSVNHRHPLADDSPNCTKDFGFQLTDRIIKFCTTYNI